VCRAIDWYGSLHAVDVRHSAYKNIFCRRESWPNCHDAVGTGASGLTHRVSHRASEDDIHHHGDSTLGKTTIDAKHLLRNIFCFILQAAQISCGMIYLQSKGLVHRDLAARNILLSSKFQAKISDFGLSRSVQDQKDYYRATKGGKWPIKW
jgi:hypothetical protein